MYKRKDFIRDLLLNTGHEKLVSIFTTKGEIHYMLDNLYRQVIMDDYRQKRNFEKLKEENVRKVHYKNLVCGDVMTLFLDPDIN